MDSGAWRLYVVDRITKSLTRLSDYTFTFLFFVHCQTVSKENRGVRAYLPILWSHYHYWLLLPIHCKLWVGKPNSCSQPWGPADSSSVGGHCAVKGRQSEPQQRPFARTRGRSKTAFAPGNHRVWYAGREARISGRSVPRFRQRLAAPGVEVAAYAVSMGTGDGAARWDYGGVWVAGPDRFYTPFLSLLLLDFYKPSILGYYGHHCSLVQSRV